MTCFLCRVFPGPQTTALTEDRGPGASAGAGGARSTVSDENASVLELALGVVNAIAPHPGATSAIAELSLLAPLLRVLPKDPTAIGPILRTLFVHTKVVEQVRRALSVMRHTADSTLLDFLSFPSFLSPSLVPSLHTMIVIRRCASGDAQPVLSVC